MVRSPLFASVVLSALSPLVGAQGSIDDLPPGEARALRSAVADAVHGIEPGDAGSFEACNPEQNMDATFRPGAVHVTGPGWTFGLALVAWGREGALVPAADIEPRVDGRRVEYPRGDLTEWYVNEARGLEQGFTIEAAPAGEDGPLQLVLAVEGGLCGRVLGGDRDARFEDAEGNAILHYAGLRAWDAAGRELEASLAVDGSRLSIRVEDEGARYPLHVDPWIATEEARLALLGGSFANGFGGSVAVEGDTAVVGASFGNEVFVFVRAGTSWTLQANLAPSSPAGQAFGSSVAISGDTVVVGASYDDPVGGVDAGSAYVFTRDGTAWSLEAKLIAADASADDHFGSAAALSGETAVIGALDDDVLGADSGSAYVFVRTGTLWSQQARLNAADGSPGDRFGGSAAFSGETAVVGADRDDSDAGSAYVFLRTGTLWSQQAKLVASDTLPGDFLGYPVSLSGDTVLAGARGSATSQGAAYVFVRSGANWSEEAKLVASDGAPADRFGAGLSIVGDTAVVGAYLDDHSGFQDAGSAYVFARFGTVWAQQAKLIGSGVSTKRSMGSSVAVSGNTAFFGALWIKKPAKWNECYVFVGGGASWNEQARLSMGEGLPGDGLGYAVSVEADRALVGAPFDRHAVGLGGGNGEGAAYLFSRSGTSWTKQFKLVASDAEYVDRFGHSVSLSGSSALIGSPLDDLAPGIPGSSAGEGSAYVLVDGGTAWGVQAKLVAGDATGGAEFGYSVAIAGDTAVVGAPGHDYLGADSGSAYVFLRTGNFWFQHARLNAADGSPGDAFGVSVAISGETIVVGADQDDHSGSSGAGSAYVFLRNGAFWSQQAKLVAIGAASDDNFGRAVSISGDTALIGAHQDDHVLGVQGGLYGQGSAHVFVRSGTSWGEQAVLAAADAAPGDRFGYSLSLSGEVALIGAPWDEARRGSSYAFERNGTVWTERVKLVGGVALACDESGHAVSLWGNTALVGAHLDDNTAGVPGSASGQGSASVFRISSGGGVTYCTAGTSAAGCRALISAVGTASATAASGFQLAITGVEGSKNGLFFYGPNGRQANPWGNGTSLVCVVPPRLRGGLLTGAGTPGNCDGSFTQDLNARWCATCSKPSHNPGVGAIMQAQLWYRDPQNTSNRPSSMSDAIEFCVAP